MRTYKAVKEDPQSNTVVGELNAKVLTATFQSKSGIQLGDLYRSDMHAPLFIVGYKTCAPINCILVETILIEF